MGPAIALARTKLVLQKSPPQHLPQACGCAGSRHHSLLSQCNLLLTTVRGELEVSYGWTNRLKLETLGGLQIILEEFIEYNSNE